MSQTLSAVNALNGATVPKPSEEWFSTYHKLPAPRRLVLYETQNQICLGYIDEMKQWRGLNGEMESNDVISWMVAKPRA